MISFRYKLKHKSPYETTIAGKITRLSTTDTFILYDKSDRIIQNLSPYFIEIFSTGNSKSNFLEEIMDKKKNLWDWKIDEFGGPELKDTAEAIHYGRLAFMEAKYLNLLKVKLVKLKTHLQDIEPTSLKDMDEISDLAFKLQYVNDSIREIVNCRFFAYIYLSEHFHLGPNCPFCGFRLDAHDEFGNCPQ